MKYQELKKKPAADLQKELDTAQFELRRLGGMVQTGGVGKDSGRIRELKRKIARIKTLQAEGKTNK